MKKKEQFFTRRRLLKSAALIGFGGALIPLPGLYVNKREKKGGLIESENKKPGTTDWQLTFVNSINYRSVMIEGYCSQTSVKAGDSIDIFLSADPPTDVSIDIYRMGYYGGKGGRHITRLGPFAVEAQPTPPVGENRIRECRWNRTAELKIPYDWVSGVYLGKLSCSGHRYQSYIVFVVRDNRKADILFQTSDITWQAYNKWPDNYSLYTTDPPVRPWNSTTRVSYDRPYGWYPQVVDQPLSQGSGSFLLWEFPLCYWLEQNNYDVTYCSNIDTHADAQRIGLTKCFISVGHDEYWSQEMYDNVKSAIQNGLNVAFLSGNAVFGVVPLNLQNWQGRPHRILYRLGFFGGPRMNYKGGYSTEVWEKHGREDEALLIGAHTMSPANGSGNWIVTNAEHWIFEGTGMKNGDMIPGLVGWEHHGAPAKIPGLEVIATGEVLKADGTGSHYAATVYPGPKGNWVFNAATIFWSMGLSQPPGLIPPYSHLGRPHGVDRRVQKITANFLNRCGI
jgi:hypothetical protein